MTFCSLETFLKKKMMINFSSSFCLHFPRIVGVESSKLESLFTKVSACSCKQILKVLLVQLGELRKLRSFLYLPDI